MFRHAEGQTDRVTKHFFYPHVLTFFVPFTELASFVPPAPLGIIPYTKIAGSPGGRRSPFTIRVTKYVTCLISSSFFSCIRRSVASDLVRTTTTRTSTTVIASFLTVHPLDVRENDVQALTQFPCVRVPHEHQHLRDDCT